MCSKYCQIRSVAIRGTVVQVLVIFSSADLFQMISLEMLRKNERQLDINQTTCKGILLLRPLRNYFDVVEHLRYKY